LRIVSDVSDPFCSVNNTTCNASIDAAFHLVNGDSLAVYQFALHMDYQADGSIDEELDPAVVLSGSCPDYLISYTMPLGAHRVVIDVTDESSDVHTGALSIDVVDCRAPAPICINGLPIMLQPVDPPADVDGDGDPDSGVATVYAVDFVASPVADCSTPVRYSINRSEMTAAVDQTSLTLTDDDVGTVIIQLHAWDSASNPLAEQPDGSTGGPNQDFCESYILVQQ